MERTSGPHDDLAAAGQLLLVEHGAAGDEDVDLQVRGVVNQVDRPALAHGPPHRRLVDIELLRQRGDERGM